MAAKVNINNAEFVKSAASTKDFIKSEKPKVIFAGKSNVGKSTVINSLLRRKNFARVGNTPGKTVFINYFNVDNSFYLVDLPGYGYAKVSAGMREKWVKASEDYILKRENLACLFVLLDSRHEPQRSDLAFMEFLGINQVPFARVFTKTDKISGNLLERTKRIHDVEMLKVWETLPSTFISSSVAGTGKDEILSFIEETLKKYSQY